MQNISELYSQQHSNAVGSHHLSNANKEGNNLDATTYLSTISQRVDRMISAVDDNLATNAGQQERSIDPSFDVNSQQSVSGNDLISAVDEEKRMRELFLRAGIAVDQRDRNDYKHSSLDTNYQHEQAPSDSDAEADEEESKGDVGEVDRDLDPDLTHTRALATALGLLDEDGSEDEGNVPELMRESESGSQPSAAGGSTSSAPASRSDLSFAPNDRNSTLSHILQEQARVTLQMARNSAGYDSRQVHGTALSRNERAELESRHRTRELETQLEMLELLDLALRASGNGSAFDGSMGEGAVVHPALHSPSRGGYGPGSTPGLSASSAEIIRRAVGNSARILGQPQHIEPIEVTRSACVEHWNSDLCSPFIEYSPDSRAVLNRSGLHSIASPMLALSTVYSRGDKVSMSVEIEYLRDVDPSEASAAANAMLPPYLRAVPRNAGNPTPSSSRNLLDTDDGHTFSFGISVLDAMPPMGTQCFGREPYTWGVYDQRRASAFSQSATIASGGILAGVCAAFCEGDVLTMVLDLDPGSITVLAPADRPPVQAGGSSKRDGKGCAHLLLNGSLKHSFPNLDLDRRYILGVTLCTNNCVRLLSKNVTQAVTPSGSAIPLLGRNTPTAIPQPQTPSVRVELPMEMMQAHRSMAASFDESDLMDLLNSMNDSVTAAVTQSNLRSLPAGRPSVEAATLADTAILGTSAEIWPSARSDRSAIGFANSNIDYGGGAFVREWNLSRGPAISGSTTPASSAPSSPARNRNPQLSRPASPPRPSPATLRLSQRYAQPPLQNHTTLTDAITLSTRAAMAQANGGPEAPVPQSIYSSETPPNYALLTPTTIAASSATGFSTGAASWREQQEQRARHQLALRAQLESQQEREKARLQAMRNADAKAGVASADSGTKDGADVKLERVDSSSSSAAAKGDGQSDTGGLCCCCWEHPKTVVLLPCRHLCTCEFCGLDETTLFKCPMCRELIVQRFKVFT